MTADTIIRARIDSGTKQRAVEALSAMGLSLSDAIRMLMLRIAEERRLPFELKVPTYEETGGAGGRATQRVENGEDLFRDLEH
ncbi:MULTISPECIES: type II toxin-antitoxin system RelB/DinJ family antitoxin [unclassified Rhizobium]|uniref:type II toxin-antitoxin system RelB/DinJ family antitoxin n=1 Tax=unclassified Rhizobium TaxID=2613769 RepID=UPI0006F96EA3|nr:MULTISPECIES: type II toxin-antitoxin system RelB/DinJ family antitoxin [unclassified Rhizobium]KQV35745.1 translation repressor RelB [Rhizobium sp. Root1212]KRD25852.1 translation repressor RelB [Rhizobium sp. Root268]